MPQTPPGRSKSEPVIVHGINFADYEWSQNECVSQGKSNTPAETKLTLPSRNSALETCGSTSVVLTGISPAQARKTLSTKSIERRGTEAVHPVRCQAQAEDT